MAALASFTFVSRPFPYFRGRTRAVGWCQLRMDASLTSNSCNGG
jgi:hypothetical protein